MEHIPVMVEEILLFVLEKRVGTVFDGTCGGGGHAKHIMEGHPEIKHYVANDQDRVALEEAKKNLQAFSEKIEFRKGNFSEHIEGEEFDFILLDIGVSSFQLDESERGFSFMREGPLDMRMDPEQDLTAKEIVNRWRKDELERIFYEYGEERFSRKIADAICQDRQRNPFNTTSELAASIEKVIRRGKIHPATRVFQALRIAVNRELHVLKEAIENLSDTLSVGGRMAIITFHSLEDRIVKNEFRDLAKTKRFALVTKKPLCPGREEQRRNKRSRSAKLRCIEKIV